MTAAYFYIAVLIFPKTYKLKYRSVAGQILNVCRANVESKLGKII